MTAALEPAAVRDRPFFVALTDDQIRGILNVSRLRACAPGDVIVEQGAPGESLYVILDGLVEIRCGSRIVGAITGEESIWAAEEGDFFGEMSLLDYRPRAATVRAATDAVVLEIPHAPLALLWSADKDLRIVLLTNMARILSRRLRRMNE